MNVKMKGMEKIISIILCFSMLFPPLVYGEDTFNNNEELFGIESESTTEQSYLLTSPNVVGYIPENSDDLMDDLGSDCIIADINSISTYSLRRSNVVELDVSGLSDSVLDVLKVWPDLDKNAWYYLDVMEATHHHIAEYINENETWNNFS